MGDSEAQMTFKNETPLERAQRELRNAKAALARIQAALVAAGAMPPDEHGLECASVIAQRMCDAINRLAASVGQAPTLGYSGPNIPTRSCPQCSGKGTVADWYIPTAAAPGQRECDRCGGSGRVVAT